MKIGASIDVKMPLESTKTGQGRLKVFQMTLDRSRTPVSEALRCLRIDFGVRGYKTALRPTQAIRDISSKRGLRFAFCVLL